MISCSVGIGYFPFFFGLGRAPWRFGGASSWPPSWPRRAVFLVAFAARLTWPPSSRRRRLDARLAALACAGFAASSARARFGGLRAPCRATGVERVPDRRRFDQHHVRPQHVIRRDVRSTACTCTLGRLRPAQVHVLGCTPSVRISTLRSAMPSRAISAASRRRLGRVVREAHRSPSTAPSRARALKRALARQRPHLARHVLRVAPRNRAEHRAAAHPVRRADRALTRAARALLLPRLLVAAGRRTRASWWPRCPAAGWRGTPSPPGASPAC